MSETALPPPLPPPPPAWLDWVLANSQPKRIRIKRPPRELTRWQKRGPMKRKDWKRFYVWAAKNAVRQPGLPKPLHEVCTGIPEPKKQKKTTPTKQDKYREKREKKKRKTLADIMERIAKLAYPRWPRLKYVYPDRPRYAYSPQIVHNKPAHRDKGRPFQPIKVPREFHHIELETEFWANVRYPVRPSTRMYKPSRNILKLAVPKISPPVLFHCPLPEPEPEYVEPRRRFTHWQWLQHLRRLEYLARPHKPPCLKYTLRYLKPPLIELCSDEGEMVAQEEEFICNPEVLKKEKSRGRRGRTAKI